MALADTADKPRILLMGPRRSGKTSIERVVFHKMSPHETLFLESTHGWVGGWMRGRTRPPGWVAGIDWTHMMLQLGAAWERPGLVQFNEHPKSYVAFFSFPPTGWTSSSSPTTRSCSSRSGTSQATSTSAVRDHRNLQPFPPYPLNALFKGVLSYLTCASNVEHRGSVPAWGAAVGAGGVRAVLCPRLRVGRAG